MRARRRRCCSPRVRHEHRYQSLPRPPGVTPVLHQELRPAAQQRAERAWFHRRDGPADPHPDLVRDSSICRQPERPAAGKEALTTLDSQPGTEVAVRPSPRRRGARHPGSGGLSAWFGKRKVLERCSLLMEPASGHRPDRAVWLWQVDIPADPQPDARDCPRCPALGPNPS